MDLRSIRKNKPGVADGTCKKALLGGLRLSNYLIILSTLLIVVVVVVLVGTLALAIIEYLH